MRLLSNFLYGPADLSCFYFPFSLLNLFLFTCAEGLWVDWCQWLVKQTWPLTQIQGWLQRLGTGSKALPRSNSKLIAARKESPLLTECVLFLHLANIKLKRVMLDLEWEHDRASTEKTTGLDLQSFSQDQEANTRQLPVDSFDQILQFPTCTKKHNAWNRILQSRLKSLAPSRPFGCCTLREQWISSIWGEQSHGKAELHFDVWASWVGADIGNR